MGKSKSPLSRSTPTHDHTDNIDTIVKPMWNTSDNARAQHWENLLEWMPGACSAHHDLVTKYMVCQRNQVCCISENHSDIIRQGLFTPGTWESPAYVRRTDAGSPAGLTILTPAEREECMKVKNFARYQESPEVVETDDNLFLELLLSTVGDKGTCAELRTSSLGSGCKFLLDFKLKKEEFAAKDTGGYGQGIVRRIATHDMEGMLEPTIESYNLYKTGLSDLVKLLPAFQQVAYPDSIIAHKHVTVVKRFGPLISTKLDTA